MFLIWFVFEQIKNIVSSKIDKESSVWNNKLILSNPVNNIFLLIAGTCKTSDKADS